MRISHLHHCRAGQICVTACLREPLLGYNITLLSRTVSCRYSLCSTNNIIPYQCEGNIIALKKKLLFEYYENSKLSKMSHSIHLQIPKAYFLLLNQLKIGSRLKKKLELDWIACSYVIPITLEWILNGTKKLFCFSRCQLCVYYVCIESYITVYLSLLKNML